MTKDEVKHAVVLGGGLLGLEAVYRDCQGFQNPQGSGVRVQEGRVGVGNSVPS